jgi:hypothetical protein
MNDSAACPSVCICVVLFSFFIFLMLSSERSFAPVHQKAWAEKVVPAAEKSFPGIKKREDFSSR